MTEQPSPHAPDMYDAPKPSDPQATGEKRAALKAKAKPAVKNWDLPGFHGKAKVHTSFGEMPLEALRLRDPVKTISGSFKRVAWIDKIHLDEDFLMRFTSAHPILLARNSVATNMPRSDVRLSPGQKVGVSQGWGKPVFKPASTLTNRPNITQAHTTYITYYLFHCGETEMVMVDGLWCKTRP